MPRPIGRSFWTAALFWEVDSLDSVDREILVERHLISRDLLADRRGPSGAALVLADGSSCGIMVNEEDHLRLQALVGGLELDLAWRQVDRLDEELGAILPLAYHHQFGFLTACPTNVGTGLRASVLVHIPGLVLTKEITKVLEGISQVGLTYRGLYGEGSEVVGNFFQISNQTTLGKTEEDLIDHLGRVTGKVIEYERSARTMLLTEAPAVLEDKVWRAYGILRTARSLGPRGNDEPPVGCPTRCVSETIEITTGRDAQRDPGAWTGRTSGTRGGGTVGRAGSGCLSRNVCSG